MAHEMWLDLLTVSLLLISPLIANDNPLTDTASGPDGSRKFTDFLSSFQCYLQVPKHCGQSGPISHHAINLSAVYDFIRYMTDCDLRKDTCERRESDKDGVNWRVVTTKTAGSGRAHSVKVHFVDREGDTIQAQKWYSRNGTARIHVHIRTSERSGNSSFVS